MIRVFNTKMKSGIVSVAGRLEVGERKSASAVALVDLAVGQLESVDKELCDLIVNENAKIQTAQINIDRASKQLMANGIMKDKLKTITG